MTLDCESIPKTQRYRPSLLVTLVIGYLIFNGAWGVAAERRLVPDTERKTIVLDPGHGGGDTGARGPDGTLEKDVTLRIAQMVAMRLRNTYRMILTRSDDYSLSITKRTEVANRHGADLFLSIHTGGDFLHTKSGITVYSYQEKVDSTLASPLEIPNPVSSGKTQRSWDRIQIDHKTAGKHLAKEIYDSFCGAQIQIRCRIETAPLMVLMGADMPAALLEAGYVTNAQDEGRMNNKDSLAEIADGITHALVGFLSARSNGPAAYQ